MNEFWKSKAIAERFEFIEELGKGGIGTVILARDRTLDKRVAIKILNANLTKEESIRFQQEGVLAGRLKHENIVSVLDFGITDTNVPYLIMEHLRGFSLDKMLTEDGALDVLFAVQISEQICRGMKSSHNQGVVHRDLKPANVIMEPNEDESLSAKIVDFGLARLIDQNARLTTAGSAIGSPLYMSPEQGQGLAGDERSDIYAMGCMMFELLTGSTPFAGDTAVHTIMMHQSVQPERLSVRAKQTIPPKLEEIVAKCLKKQPEDRYQNFSELLHDLEKLEAEIIRLEREEFLEDGSRSGIQRALSSVTDFGTPLTSMSSKGIGTKGFVILALVVIVGFGTYVLVPQLMKGTEEKLPKTEEVVQFTDAVKSFHELKTTTEDGRVTCKGYGETNDEDLQQLNKVYRLDKLDLSNSGCDGTGLRDLSASTIVELILNSCQVNDDGMAAISKVKGLTRLSLKDCDLLKDQSFRRLANCKTLKDLSFSGTGLTENSFSYLQTYRELLYLGLDEFHITQPGMAQVLKIPNLRAVLFEECELDDGAFGELQTFKNSPFADVGFESTKFTSKIFSQLKNVRTKHITLMKASTTKSVFSQISKDPRYGWSELEVDGKKVADRG